MSVQADNAAFQGLYRAHRQAVWSYCVRRLPRKDVQDAVSDVFVVAWRRRDQAPEGDEALLWLYGVARNVVRNSSRSETRRRRLGQKLSSMQPEYAEASDVPVVRRAEDKRLLDAVARLAPDERELLRLRTWEELPINDIADIVGRSPRSVESKLARIRKKLARQLTVPAGSTGTVRPRYAEEGGDR